MKTAVIAEQGLRWSMEDAHFLDTDFIGQGWVFGGVYDGHSGRQAAEFSAVHLHAFVLKHLQAGSDPETAFIRAYEETSEQLAFQDSGTTAVTFLLQGDRLTVANAGDSRAVLIDPSGARQLTRDHRLEDSLERERVERTGGRVSPPYVMRGFRGLMPTRTIGDQYFKAVGIIATPSTARFAIHRKDRFLVAACDGLFDVMTNDEVAATAAEQPDAESLAEALRREALEVRMGTDNLTILVVQLDS